MKTLPNAEDQLLRTYGTDQLLRTCGACRLLCTRRIRQLLYPRRTDRLLRRACRSGSSPRTLDDR